MFKTGFLFVVLIYVFCVLYTSSMFIISFCLLFPVQTKTNQYRYDYIFSAEANGWLKLHPVPATWHDAWLRCNLEGAILASPDNIYLNLVMRQIMKNQRVTWGGVFTGLHATFSKGDFFSVNGVPLNRMPVDWMPSEPDNKNNDEDCILFAFNGTVADVNCKEVHPYMCFKQKTNNMILNGCGTFDQEYNLDTRTGSCYKFHRVPRNWTRAFMTCAAEGAYLAIINSETESNVLRELFSRYPQDSIHAAISRIMREIAHIGFHNWGEHGSWTTIHGTSLIDAGFDVWAEKQPDNAPPGENCGGMFRNGRLNDVWCHETGPFICEKSPDSLRSDEDL